VNAILYYYNKYKDMILYYNMSLIKEYFELTKKYQDEYGENTILLMQVGAFFEVYGINDKKSQTITGSKIQDFCQICELNIVDKNTCVGESGVMMAGFKDIQIERYIKKIQDAGFTAVVYAQDENMKNTTRSLAGIFSPGTYFHNETQNLTNSTSCIWIDFIENKLIMKGKYVVVGISNIDIYTGKTTIFQFKEIYVNNPTTYDELERFMSIYNPSEVILISNLPDEKELDSIISYAGISCKLIHKINLNNIDLLTKTKSSNVKNCEKQSYQKVILSKFYNFDNFDIFIQNFNDNNIATQSLCYLLDFIYQHNPQLVNKITEPVFESTTKRLTMANHSLKQLNIINDGNVKATKYSCVSQMLNNCLTPMGKRKFLYNILNPICDEEILNREYNITEYILNNFNYFDAEFKHKLNQIKDLSKYERQMFLKKISPKSFTILYNNLKSILETFNFIQNDVTIVEYLKSMDSNVLNIGNKCKSLINFLEENINVDLAKDIDVCQQFEINFIQPGIDIELDNKMELLNNSENRLDSIREFLNSLIEIGEKKSKSNELVKIYETEKNNISLVCTARRCNVLHSMLPDNDEYKQFTIKIGKKTEDNFSIKYSKSQFTYEIQSSSNNIIVHDYINSLCKNISSTKISMKNLITSVYNQIVEQFGSFQKEIERISNFITIIDIIHTKASIAKMYNYCKPTIVDSDKSFVNIKGLRHCLIEQFNLNELYITNDITLGDGNTDGILLFGTNAVGKTTIIRALGISVILAQAGLFVPCTEFTFKPYKSIFTRIIGNDNIFKGLSTFEVEMSELRTILRMMNENSLVLGDELCSGTETISAISIFVAGVQRLCQTKSSFIFATHLHEIVDYEEIKEMKTVHLKHMEVIYNKEQDMLIYNRKLKDGSGANVYGLEVCKSLSLPSDFLEAANIIRLKYNTDGKSMLSLKQSRYNANKIVSLCEKCGKNMGTEVHHLQYQMDANENGIIKKSDSVFHKNNLANLMTLCESCHDELHSKDIKMKKVKTTKGIKIINA
jgi:DNA mismatch repair protein MutS